MDLTEALQIIGGMKQDPSYLLHELYIDDACDEVMG